MSSHNTPKGGKESGHRCHDDLDSSAGAGAAATAANDAGAGASAATGENFGAAGLGAAARGDLPSFRPPRAWLGFNLAFLGFPLNACPWAAGLVLSLSGRWREADSRAL